MVAMTHSRLTIGVLRRRTAVEFVALAIAVTTAVVIRSVPVGYVALQGACGVLLGIGLFKAKLAGWKRMFLSMIAIGAINPAIEVLVDVDGSLLSLEFLIGICAALLGLSGISWILAPEIVALSNAWWDSNGKRVLEGMNVEGTSFRSQLRNQLVLVGRTSSRTVIRGFLAASVLMSLIGIWAVSRSIEGSFILLAGGIFSTLLFGAVARFNRPFPPRARL